MANPIWKDYFVDLGTADYVDFRIVPADYSFDYRGRAWKKPGAASVSIRINDIIADDVKARGKVTYLVSIYEGDEYNTIDSIEVYNDWSYDYQYNPESMGMAFPAVKKIDARQYLAMSFWNTNGVIAEYTDAAGNKTQKDVVVGSSLGGNTCFYKIPSDAKSVKIGNVTFQVVNGSSRYALYYVNAYGGWDSLLIEGSSAEVDNITRMTREVQYDNRIVSNRGKVNSLVEITKAMTLHTSWMTDEESSRMHHLLNSTEVFLLDMTIDEMIPVVLNNSTTEYKTFKGNGGKLINYAIEVELNCRLRR